MHLLLLHLLLWHLKRLVKVFIIIIAFIIIKHSKLLRLLLCLIKIWSLSIYSILLLKVNFKRMDKSLFLSWNCLIKFLKKLFFQ